MRASNCVVSNFFGCKDNDNFNIIQEKKGKIIKKFNLKIGNIARMRYLCTDITLLATFTDEKLI